MTQELREYFEIKRDQGVLVVRVEAESPAAEADIRVGDVIVGVEGTPVRRPRDLRRLVGRAPEGAALAIEVVREGNRREVRVALAEGEDWSWRGHPRDLLPELFPDGPDRT
jgi:serine protease Do